MKPRRAVSRPVLLLSASAIAISFAIGEAAAQATLPPLTIEAPRKAAPKAKRVAPKAKAATEVTQASPPLAAPLKALETLPAASAEAAAAKLDVKNATGSALQLTARETPATVNIVTQKDIEERGARGLVETFRLVPGVVVGNNPGEVGTTTTRGFYKGAAFLVDGSRVADPVFLGRDYNSFHFDRVEVLKGPASVVSGTSGLAGAFNIITKQATTERTFTEGMVSYGSFNTWDTGVGLNVALSPQAAVRSTFTFSNSNGYVEDTDSERLGFSTNILLKPSDRLTISTSIDYFKDDYPTAYYATPLIPRSVARDPTDVVRSSDGLVLDRSIRYKNYNFLDGNMNMESVWLRNAVEYRLTDQWTLRNELSYYSADRLWRDGDFYTYTAAKNDMPSGITRNTTFISHDHEFWSERMVLRFDGDVGGVRNRLAAGAEYMETTFGSTRRFGSTGPVDVFFPDRGFFPEGTLGTRETADHVTKTVFAEHAINLTPAWILAAGIRYEAIDLDRTSFIEKSGETTPFGNDLGATTWRIGSTYELFPGTTLFAQYAEAVTPVSSALMIASATNAQFKLTTGNSVELGMRSRMLGGRVTTMASVYQIEQDDIITFDSATPPVANQGGSQRSRGVEVEAAISLTDRWNVSLSGTLIDSEFTDLRDRDDKNLVGNRPLNTVPWAWSALMTYRLEGLPATVGAQLTGVGPFYTGNSNLYEARERTVLDAWVAFDLGKGTLRLRARNLTDEFYAEWADYNEKSVYVGAPRGFDVTYSIKW